WHIIFNSFYKLELIKEVTRKFFSPPPRTDSVLISIKQKKPNRFEKIVRSIVLQDDKKLKNSIIKTFRDEFKLTNNQAKDKLFELLIPENILEKNVDYLSNKQFIFVIEKLRNLPS
ncbi:MAG: rRNA adenine N-6-methyltransferase family protein, partial [Nanoarchaeota archaeon]